MAYNGYSAKVSLRLVVGDATLVLSHVGSRWLIVMDDCKPVPECNGELIIKIGERETKSVIYLPQGIIGPGQRMPYF